MDLGKLRALVNEIRERARIGETVGQEAGSSVAGCVASGAGIAWEDAAKRLSAVVDDLEFEERTRRRSIETYGNNPAWPDPSPEMREDPRFEAVWQCIKTWDVAVPAVYRGYCGATGNHVRAILDALATTDRWIPVSEQLPEAFDDVWIVTLGGWVGRATYLPASPRHPACFRVHTRRGTEYDVDQVTHWRPSPLPEPPTKGS